MNRIVTQNGTSIFNIDNARNISVHKNSIRIIYPSPVEGTIKYIIATYETDEEAQEHFRKFKHSLLTIGESFFDFSDQDN